MTKLQFRVLYREFLFRMVDLELLSSSAQGDLGKLLGQVAALLIFVSLGFTLAAFSFGDSRMARADLLIGAWSLEHSLLAMTMLVVGIFAVLSWDSTFLDQRDVLVLAPLPVRPRTLFLAKVAASATALSLTVVALDAFPSLAWPPVLAPASSSLLNLILSPALYRSFAAYWITTLSAGAFIFCSVLGVQGLAAQLLPRHRFLRLSAFLQTAAFCLFLSVYFLEPSLATPKSLAAPENQRLLAWLPAYWFLGLFQELNGSMHPAMIPLARRAWTGLAIAVFVTCTAYLLSYFRTLRKIIEEPDILPSSRGLKWSPRCGNALQTAIVQFTVRTLLRSRQHRVTLAFYLGIGFAIVIFLLRGGVARGEQFASHENTRLLFSSFVILCVWIVGTRIVFSIPLALRANWIFRITQIRSAPEYLSASRRALFVLAVAPVWLASATFFLSIWPWQAAMEHLMILGLWGMAGAYVSLIGFQKIPFTCSYLPGKSYFHIGLLVAMVLMPLLGKGVEFESRALSDPVCYSKILIVLAIAAIAVRWRSIALAKSDEAIVQFEELPPPAILSLGLHRDGVLPIKPHST